MPWLPMPASRPDHPGRPKNHFDMIIPKKGYP
jgi:hypothetical protein